MIDCAKIVGARIVKPEQSVIQMAGMFKIRKKLTNARLNQMLLGSYYAGAAFTKAYVGYVHAIAHAIGGLYGVLHGYANAVILPVVLQEYSKAVYNDLADLADAVGITGHSKQEQTEKFIAAIQQMNRYMGIQKTLNVVKEEDVPEIIKRALKEANPAYPVPVIWDEKQLWKVIEAL